MQERPSSFWRRLVGFADRISGSATGKESNRRRWERRDVNVETTCQSVNTPNAPREPARLCNISPAGLSLRVRRRFSPGESFRVDLPSIDGRPAHAVLACVIYAAALADGDWTVGCTITRELCDGDLEAFGAGHETPGWADERSFVRYQCSTKATYVIASADLPVPHAAQVLNISPTGIGLLVDQPIKTGTLLSLDLPVGKEHPPLTILANVIHTSSHPTGQWALGCTFVRELTPRELGGLV